MNDRTQRQAAHTKKRNDAHEAGPPGRAPPPSLPLPLPCPWLDGGPTVKRGRDGDAPEPELPAKCEALTMTGQGNLCERRMSRAEDGVGGSVAGSERVCEGIADWVARSRTVRLEGVKVTSYVIGAWCRRV